MACNPNDAVISEQNSIRATYISVSLPLPKINYETLIPPGNIFHIREKRANNNKGCVVFLMCAYMLKCIAGPGFGVGWLLAKKGE